MPKCKKCQNEFEISPVGKRILDTLKIPLPEVCDVCAMRLLMSFRNERIFYSRKCDNCQKDIIGMYPADSPFTVYCNKCWWGDSWDGTIHGLEYQRPEKFFEQLKELQKQVPREALVNLNSPNCDYSNHIRDSKSCYMCSLVSMQCEECFYCYWIVEVKDSADCYYGRDNQKCYFCVVTWHSYNCSYLLQAENCLDCHYCYDIKGCNNCMLSSNLRNQSYVFTNKQLTKEEYEHKVKEVKRNSWFQSRKYWNEWQQLIQNAIHQYSYQIKCENCIGDNLQNNINVELGYNTFETENAYNAASLLFAKNIFNGFAIGDQPVDWGANIAVTKGGSQVISCYNTVFSSDIYFSENLVSCMDCLGCIGLKHKKYCILNKQYSEGEYQKIKKELIDYWTKTGVLSEFLPVELSAFAYNETAAQDFYPLTKEQALNFGYRWKDDLPGNFSQETIKAEEIPDVIEEISDDILKQTLGCINCGRNYKVIRQELKFYRSLGLPIPRECFNCRFRQRLDLMGDRELIERQCTCEIKDHQYHQGKRCSNKFITKYKGEVPAKVYCEECYQKEIY